MEKSVQNPKPRSLEDQEMSDGTGEYAQLTELLKTKGHSDEEIAQVLERVRKYDKEMEVDSVMDSIAAGRMDLSSIIKEALEGG